MNINICNTRIDKHSFDEIVSAITNYALENKEPQYVVTPNAHHIVALQSDAYFRKIYQNAFLSVPDGVSLLWAANFLKTPLNGRVNGTDLFESLCASASNHNMRVFLLGGRPGAAEGAAQILQRQHPSLKIAGTYCPPYGFEKDTKECEHINNIVRAASPHILFVGLGAPKQEKWIYENYQQLSVPISIGIGVSFELVSGTVTRAPKIMQKTGLEWLFRLFMEPRRLWKRYVVGNTVFVWLVIKQRLGILKN